MRQSKLFTKTRRDAPADEVAKNAQLLIRAGYVNKEMAGVYDYLPLGLRTLNKIIGIIREEMDALGGEEVFMSSLQRKELWQTTNRWNEDVWFKTMLALESEQDGSRGKEIGLGFTHEEALTNMMQQFVLSYKDLPRYVYQFQTKFRNEKRSKSGVMRTREFIMKDLYSFSKDAAEHEAFYEKAKQTYKNIFTKLGIADKTYLTYASGGSFAKFSHEFQTLCDAGEDVIYINKADYGKGLAMPSEHAAINKEIFNEDLKNELRLEGDFEERKAIEVGNIFTLGTKFSEALGLKYKDTEGKDLPVFMGSYGIGPGRVMGTIVELLADDKGLVWPESVSPFKYHLVSLGKPGDDITSTADELYEDFVKAGVEVLYDDREVSAGQKFAESDLLGISKRIVVGRDAVATDMYEVVDRATGAVTKESRAALTR